MPKDVKLTDLTVADIAELLGVTPRQVRNWIAEKGLPAKDGNRGRILNWPETLTWFVAYRISEGGNGGNGKAAPGQNTPDEPEEDYDHALARKVRAEADLTELKLARERGQVAAIADVEKVLSAANSSTRTLIQAFPAQLAPQLLGLEDRAAIYTLLQRECGQLLGNIATMAAILEAGEIAQEEYE
jgi:phage terminase Nu1 subunit (DNA packaging protein)